MDPEFTALLTFIAQVYRLNSTFTSFHGSKFRSYASLVRANLMTFAKKNRCIPTWNTSRDIAFVVPHYLTRESSCCRL